MSPFRLLVLAFLGYILYRLLVAPKTGPSASAPPDDHHRQVDDVLVEDPICHTYIPRQGAESWTMAGATHYFCSPECRKKFQSEQRR
jgi:YHS domain-containing protein